MRDAYAALAYLRTLSYVDGRRVGVMGGSHGGTTTLATMVAAESETAPLAQDKRAGFAAAVALYPGFEMKIGWQGWFAPANTPGEIVTRLQTEIHKALHAPKVRDFLVADSYDPIGNSPDQFRKFIDSELQRYAEIARVAKIRVE